MDGEAIGLNEWIRKSEAEVVLAKEAKSRGIERKNSEKVISLTS